MELDSYALVCLPPAGCSANIYQPFKKYVTKNCHLVALEYPGHGRKLAQPLETSIERVAAQLAQEIISLPEQDIILFGHSLGAGLIWPILDALKQQQAEQRIKMLVISSRPAPNMSQHLINKQHLSDQQLTQQLRDYNYLPEAILNNPELMRFCLKLIRHDFALSDALILNHHSLPSDIPAVVVYGHQDPDLLHPSMLEAWQSYTKQWLGTIELSGDHFYFSHPDVLQRMLAEIQQKFKYLQPNNAQVDA
jgi:surfactin synthase thioesterase subunit